MTRFVPVLRAQLADALEGAAPGSPTLCEGWTAHDLAAHVVIRERRPDAALGLLVPGLAPWTERVRRRRARLPHTDLVALVRSGPPRLSPLTLPAIDERANLTEFFVHTEDVLRAVPGWTPRSLPPDQLEALWRSVRGSARFLYRGVPTGVRLRGPDGTVAQVRPGPEAVELRGPVPELVLHAFGRTAVAEVEVVGPADAVRRFRETVRRI